MSDLHKKPPLRIHLVAWEQCEGWYPENGKNVTALCGMWVQEPLVRRASWADPSTWFRSFEPAWCEPCPKCMGHPDYPIVVLGGVE